MLFLSLIVAFACGTALIDAGDPLPIDDTSIVKPAAEKVVTYINENTGNTGVLKSVDTAELETIDPTNAKISLVITVAYNVGGEPKESKCSPELDFLPEKLDYKVKKTKCDDPKLNKEDES